MEVQETCPLPHDPALAELADALSGNGHWGLIVDQRWRTVYMTDELRLTFGAQLEFAPVPLGDHYFGPEAVRTSLEWPAGANRLEFIREVFTAVGHWVLADTPGGRKELTELVDPALRDIVDGLSPGGPSVVARLVGHGTHSRGKVVDVPILAMRVRDEAGWLAGTAMINKPAPGMNVLAAMAAGGDLSHFQCMQQVAKPARRPAAILFADLEASSLLARRLSTASYFSLGRRLTRAADQCVVDAGGLVGRHVGDGMVAFFLAETAGSESAAARACVHRDCARPMLQPAASSQPRMWSCASAFTGEPRCTSGRYSQAAALRSRRSGTRSTRALASRRAPPVAAPSPQRSCSSAWIPRMAPPLTWTPTAPPTRNSPTCPPQPRRHDGTHPQSPSARCRARASAGAPSDGYPRRRPYASA